MIPTQTVQEQAAYRAGIPVCNSCHRSIDPYGVAAEIWEQLDVDRMQPDPDLDQKMTWAQVRALAGDPLFTVGGHSHTHRILEFLSDEELVIDRAEKPEPN